MVRVAIVNWQRRLATSIIKSGLIKLDQRAGNLTGSSLKYFFASPSALNRASPVASAVRPMGDETDLARSAICPLARPGFRVAASCPCRT